MVLFLWRNMDKSKAQISEILSILRKKQAEEAKEKKKEDQKRKLQEKMHKLMIEED